MLSVLACIIGAEMEYRKTERSKSSMLKEWMTCYHACFMQLHTQAAAACITHRRHMKGLVLVHNMEQCSLHGMLQGSTPKEDMLCLETLFRNTQNLS